MTRHDHNHAPGKTADFGRAFFIATTLNVLFVVLGVVYGVLAHSVALLADAAHNLGDVVGLLLAWGASVLSKRGPTRRRTYASAPGISGLFMRPPAPDKTDTLKANGSGANPR